MSNEKNKQRSAWTIAKPFVNGGLSGTPAGRV